MTSLIPKTANPLPAVSAQTAAPATAQTAAPANAAPQMELSPEAKSTLTSGLMTGVLGAMWFAKPKIEGANSLMQLEKDKFESATKKLENLKNPEQKAAFECIKELRNALTTESKQTIDSIFKGKDVVSQAEALQSFDKNIKTTEELDKYLSGLKSKIEKTPAILPDKDGITEKLIKSIDENPNIDKKYVADFKAKFPAGSKPTAEECGNFAVQYLQKSIEKLNDGEKIKRILAATNTEGNITKTNAQKAIKQYIIDSQLDNLQACFEALRSKFPKARLKSAVKWFGIGLAVSMASNFVFSLFGKKASSK